MSDKPKKIDDNLRSIPIPSGRSSTKNSDLLGNIQNALSSAMIVDPVIRDMENKSSIEWLEALFSLISDYKISIREIDDFLLEVEKHWLTLTSSEKLTEALTNTETFLEEIKLYIDQQPLELERWEIVMSHRRFREKLQQCMILYIDAKTEYENYLQQKWENNKDA